MEGTSEMSEVHDLTDNEIKAIEAKVAQIRDVAGTVKKLMDYIRSVNATNYNLKKNLDESIKAGDVTNEHKAYLECHERAIRNSNYVYDQILATCNKMGCKCEESKRDTCPVYQEFLVAGRLIRAMNGDRFSILEIFKYASIGRKILRGFTPCDARQLQTDVVL